MRAVVIGSSLLGIALATACSASGTSGDDGSSSSSGGTSTSTSSSGGSSSGKVDGGKSSSSSSSGGSSSSSGGSTSSSSSGGSSSGGSDGGTDASDGSVPITNPVLSLVKAGAQFLGVTTDATPHVVYFTAANTIEATPVAGGAPVVLATGLAATDSAVVNGGAVAWFTGKSATTNLFAATHVWTKTYGQKDITTGSHGIFAASEDGTRLAIEVGSTDDLSAQIAITDAAAPVIAAPALSGANAVNLQAFAADNCAPQLGFAANVFIGAFCTGTVSTTVNARLVTVGAADATATLRLDDTTAGIFPSWSADATGTKIAVADRTTATAKVVITAGATTTVGSAEVVATFPTMISDGSAMVYLTGTDAFKKATAAATPVLSTLATGVLGLHTSSVDRKRFAYWTQESGAGDFNLITIDASSATPTAATVVATPVAYGVAFSGDGSKVVYLDTYNDTDGTGKLKSKPAAGGTEILLDAASFAVFPAQTGTGVLSVTAVAAVTGGTASQRNLTVKYSDAAVGGALKTGASNVLFDTDSAVAATSAWSGKTFVHTTVAATPTISKLVLP